MVEASEVTDWYTVIDSNGRREFMTCFYESSFDHSPGFFFDGPDGNNWFCYDLDEFNHIICGELVDDVMTREINGYLEDQGRSRIINPAYGYIEAKINNSGSLSLDGLGNDPSSLEG